MAKFYKQYRHHTGKLTAVLESMMSHCRYLYDQFDIKFLKNKFMIYSGSYYIMQGTLQLF